MALATPVSAAVRAQPVVQLEVCGVSVTVVQDAALTGEETGSYLWEEASEQLVQHVLAQCHHLPEEVQRQLHDFLTLPLPVLAGIMRQQLEPEANAEAAPFEPVSVSRSSTSSPTSFNVHDPSVGTNATVDSASAA